MDFRGLCVRWALKNTSKLNLHTTDENGAKIVFQTELDSVKTLFEKSLK